MINHNWHEIHRNGYSVEFTTLTGGWAYAYLTLEGCRVARVDLRSNRVNAKEMIRLAKECGPATRISYALARLLEAIPGRSIAIAETECLSALLTEEGLISKATRARL